MPQGNCPMITAPQLASQLAAMLYLYAKVRGQWECSNVLASIAKQGH